MKHACVPHGWKMNTCPELTIPRLACSKKAGNIGSITKASQLAWTQHECHDAHLVFMLGQLRHCMKSLEIADRQIASALEVMLQVRQARPGVAFLHTLALLHSCLHDEHHLSVHAIPDYNPIEFLATPFNMKDLSGCQHTRQQLRPGTALASKRASEGCR
eukprot:1157918-Pelagomonas_calceolata.AAC.7